MITKIKLPKADANMQEATIGEWFVKEGDRVKKGTPLVDLVTDKTTFELDAPKAGTLLRIVAPEGITVPVSYIIALLGRKDDTIPDISGENHNCLEKFQDDSFLKQTDTAEQKRVVTKSKRIRATPAAKRLSREHGIALHDVITFFNAEVVNEKLIREFMEKQN